MSGDPHFTGAHGDLFSFRGGNGTIYAMHSSRHLQVCRVFIFWVETAFQLGRAHPLSRRPSTDRQLLARILCTSDNAHRFSPAHPSLARPVPRQPRACAHTFANPSITVACRMSASLHIAHLPHTQVNARFMLETFVMGGRCEFCGHKTVHGSFIKSIYVIARTAGNLTVFIEYNANQPSNAQLHLQPDGFGLLGLGAGAGAGLGSYTCSPTDLVCSPRAPSQSQPAPVSAR